ncbi:MAG: cytochrome c biogenesis protein CcsA [Sandaracinaceae bacterium]|nr:cytochrome c biogenesis protein CcsA [Sandaracinaceae bacterium]
MGVLYALSGAGYFGLLLRGDERLGRAAHWALLWALALHFLFLISVALFAHGTILWSIDELLRWGSWGVAFSYVLTLQFKRRGDPKRLRALGAFVLPLVLLFFLVAGPPRGVEVPERFRSLLRLIHIASNALGLAAFAVAFATSIAYLFAERALRRKQARTSLSRLPPLDTLDAMALRMVWLGFPLLTIGAVTGAFWAMRLDPNSPPIGWNQAMALIEWVLFGVLLLLRVVAGWRGRRAAWGTLLGFLVGCAVLVGYAIRSGPR